LLVDPRHVPGWTTVLASVLGDRALSGRLTRAGAEVARSVTWRRGAAALRSLLAEVAAGRLPAEQDISPPDPLTTLGTAKASR
jgi:hypothetical protein